MFQENMLSWNMDIFEEPAVLMNIMSIVEEPAVLVNIMTTAA